MGQIKTRKRKVTRLKSNKACNKNTGRVNKSVKIKFIKIHNCSMTRFLSILIINILWLKRDSLQKYSVNYLYSSYFKNMYIYLFK